MATRKRRLLRAAAFGGASTAASAAPNLDPCKSSEITVTERSYDRMDLVVFRIAVDLGSPFGLDHFAGVSETTDNDHDLVICVIPRNNISPGGYTINLKDDSHKN